MMTPPVESTGRWLRRFTKLVAASTVFLIYAGAMVTSTGSGLAVPDWPLSYGMLMPPMVGGIFYEHGHRMIAATVGLLTVIQAVWLQRSEPKSFVRKLGWISLLAVVVQGVLGGITVLLLLPKPVSISHAALAEIFLCLNVAIAFFTSRFYERLSARRGTSGDLRVTTRALVAAVFVQMLLGAWMRHLGAGLAIPDFPLSFGQLVPPLETVGIAANFLHRLGAVAVVVVAVLAGVKIRRDGQPSLRALLGAIMLALAVQVTLGAFTIWTGKNPIVTSFHVMIGAATLALVLILALAASVVGREEREEASLTEREVAA